MKWLSESVIVLFVLTWCYPGWAAVIRVPGDQPNIQIGIDAAVNGDTVLVSEGTYSGPGNRDIDLKGKAITVISPGGWPQCIIDIQGSDSSNHRGFIFQTGESQDTTVSGFTVTGGYISGPYPQGVGGAIICDGSSPTIANCSITGNYAEHLGGGIYCKNNASPSITDCFINQNIAGHNGGGIYSFQNSQVMLSGCTIDSNSSTYEGGGLFIDSDVHITNTDISNNESGYGAGLHIDPDTASFILNCNFSDNISQNYGGGIDYVGGPDLYVTDSDFLRNTAVAGGGGLSTYSQQLHLNSCTFTGNTSDDKGGGLYITNSTVTILNCPITQNSALGDGGGMFLIDSQLDLVNCELEDNFAGNDGGGVTIVNASATISRSMISSNQASNHGGGLFCRTNSITAISESLITYNNSKWGGGISCNAAVLNVDISGISNNTAVYDGGGVYVYNANPYIAWCSITGNMAGYGGGIYSLDHAGVILKNSLLFLNTANTEGGGLFCWYLSGPFLLNCTVSGNNSGAGGGLFCIDGSPPIIANSVFWSNSPDEISDNSGTAQVSYSDIMGGAPGDGNIDADPLFVSGTMGNYYLSQTASGQPQDSPCIDTGNDYPDNVCFDSTRGEQCLDGFTTRTDHVNDTVVVDMGFHYPHDIPSPTLSPTPTPTVTPTPSPSPVPTMPCSYLGCRIDMPSDYYTPGDGCHLYVFVCNTTQTVYQDQPVFILLEIYGDYFFAPSFSEFDYYPVEIPAETYIMLTAIPHFLWPEGTGSADGIFVYAAITNKSMSALLGQMDVFSFGWGE